MDALGLELEGEGEGYYSSGSIPGAKHFGIWPLSQAAEACFGTPEWPADRIVPQASIEFEVESTEAVAAAGDELERAGFELLHPAPHRAVGADGGPAPHPGRLDRGHLVRPRVSPIGSS